MSTEGNLEDLTSNFNIIETQVYAVEPQEGHYPTLRVNSSVRPGYSRGQTSSGRALNLEGPAFKIRFEPETELPDSDFGHVDSVLESDQDEHQEYRTERAHVKMYPDYIVNPSENKGAEILDKFEWDGTANIEQNDDFTLH